MKARPMAAVEMRPVVARIAYPIALRRSNTDACEEGETAGLFQNLPMV